MICCGAVQYLSPRYYSSSVLSQTQHSASAAEHRRGYYSPGGSYHRGLQQAGTAVAAATAATAPAGTISLTAKANSSNTKIDSVDSAADNIAALAAEVASLSVKDLSTHQHQADADINNSQVANTSAATRRRCKCNTELQAVQSYIHRASHRCVYPQPQYRSKRRQRSYLRGSRGRSTNPANIIVTNHFGAADSGDGVDIDGSEGDCTSCFLSTPRKISSSNSSNKMNNTPTVNTTPLDRGCSVAVDDDDDDDGIDDDDVLADGSASDGYNQAQRIVVGSRRAGWSSEDHLCIVRLSFVDGKLQRPTLVNSKYLPGSLMKAITSTKLSSTCRYALVGYGVRVQGDVQDHSHR